MSTDFKIHLGVPLTHSDYMLHEDPAIVNGPEGVKHMLDTCKASGWKRVYWRTFDGGRANYKSKLVMPGMHFEANSFFHPKTPEDQAFLDAFYPVLDQNVVNRIEMVREMLDYSEFDSLACAVEYGKEIGLEIHAWITINEDDHGWGAVSDFARKYPECRWVRRNGKKYRSQMSFAFPEVMDYKVALVEEILSYGVDGIFLDWMRTGDVRDDPQNDSDGAADRGYERPLVKSFQEKYGEDPFEISNCDERWVQHRCEPHTEFMRRIRELTSRLERPVPIAAMVYHPWARRGLGHRIDGNFRGMHLDLRTWAREGLIDSVVATDYFIEGKGSPEEAFQFLKEETEGRVRLWTFAWVPQDVSDFEKALDRARKLGADQLLFWEADYIELRKDREPLQAAMRAASQDL